MKPNSPSLKDKSQLVPGYRALFYYPNQAASVAGLFSNQTRMLWRSNLKVVIVMGSKMFQNRPKLITFLDRAPPNALIVTKLNDNFDEYATVRVREIKDADLMTGLVKKEERIVKLLGNNLGHGKVLTAQVQEYFPFTISDGIDLNFYCFHE